LPPLKITIAESLIMQVLWAADGPVAVEDLRTALKDEDWTDATIRTLLGRLAQKKAVAARKDGRRFLYRPLVARGDYVHAEAKTLIDRFFGGQLSPFVAHFSAYEKLSEEDLARLRSLIDTIDDKG
jgi:BlaI family penicillinase repressor